MKNNLLCTIIVSAFALTSCGSVKLTASSDAVYSKKIPMTLMQEVYDDTGTTEEFLYLMEQNNFKFITYINAIKEYNLDKEIINRSEDRRGEFIFISQKGHYRDIDRYRGDEDGRRDEGVTIENINIGSININSNNSSSGNSSKSSGSDTISSKKRNIDRINPDSSIITFNVKGKIGNVAIKQAEKDSSSVKQKPVDPYDRVYGMKLHYRYYYDLLYYSFKNFYIEVIDLRTGDLIMTVYFAGDKRSKAVVRDIVKKLNVRFRE